MKRFWRVIHSKLGNRGLSLVWNESTGVLLIVALCQFRGTTTLCLVLTTYWIADSSQTDDNKLRPVYLVHFYPQLRFFCSLAINKSCKIAAADKENEVQSEGIKAKIERCIFKYRTRDKIYFIRPCLFLHIFMWKSSLLVDSHYLMRHYKWVTIANNNKNTRKFAKRETQIEFLTVKKCCTKITVRTQESLQKFITAISLSI